MKVSLNTIKQYIDFELPPVDELVARINQQLGTVEEVTDLTAKYKDVVIVKVVESEKHPNADKLSVCMIDDGGTVSDVDRDERGLVRVVCGAPNVHADMFAAWLPPRSTVPATFNDAEPFVLDARELRGIKSNGMLAAADELALGSDHDGIIEINLTEWRPSSVEIKPGASFAAVYGLNDTIIDIENKMFTHRPDCFGQLGVAREIAGIFGEQFVSPEWYAVSPKFEDNTSAQGQTLELNVFNEASDKVPRFMAVVIDNVTVKPSPLWLQIELIRLGGKPINNIVDVTNYVMLLTAQPTHAYDYDKLRGHTLGARLARDGENCMLLNGKSYTLTADDIVIVDGEGIVGLGGVMGGGNSEVSVDTKRIVLEVANFDMYTVRKTSMRYGLFTDALTRFSKGQSPLQNPTVLSLLMQSVADVAGGAQASEVYDIVSFDDCVDVDGVHCVNSLGMTTAFVNERLGLNLNDEEIVDLLGNVECRVEVDPDGLEIYHPFWRTDIELPEDIVEEVGRLYGFDKLPRELPRRSITPASKNVRIETKRRLREKLSCAGANEVLTYSFVHERTLRNANQDLVQAYALSNALSPDLQYYRLSLTPSLLDKVHMNSKAGHDEFALFEIGKAHRKGDEDDGLPREYDRLGLIYAAKKSDNGAAYFQAKRLLDQISRSLIYVPLNTADINGHEILRQMSAPFEPTRAAFVMNGEKYVGVVGEYKAEVVRAFKLPSYCAGFEVFLSYFTTLSPVSYRPLSRFPSVTQDISLRVTNDVHYEQVSSVVSRSIDESTGPEVQVSIAPLSIYQSENDIAHKIITLRVLLVSSERTLADSDVAPWIDAAAEAAWREMSAERA